MAQVRSGAIVLRGQEGKEQGDRPGFYYTLDVASSRYLSSVGGGLIEWGCRESEPARDFAAVDGEDPSNWYCISRRSRTELCPHDADHD